MTYPLSNHLNSSLQWKTGKGSFMKGVLQYDNQKWAISSAVQVCFIYLNQSIENIENCFSWELLIHLEQLMVFIDFLIYAIYDLVLSKRINYWKFGLI